MLEWAIQQSVTHFPQIAGYSALIIVVTVLTWKVAHFYGASKSIHKEFPDIKSLLTKIESGLSTLNQVLLEKNVINKSCFSNANSPRIINEKGNDLLKISGSLPAYESVKKDFLTTLESRKFESLLELERVCLNLFLEKMNDPRLIPIQNYVFEHPTYNDNPVGYVDILFLLSLKLRDYYREKHPELNK